MTPYEIVDASLGAAEHMTQSFRWWVSVTFAALVAAYTAGANLAGLPCLLVILLYILVSANSVVIQLGLTTVFVSLGEEVLAYEKRAQTSSPALDALKRANARRKANFYLEFTSRGVLFVGTIGYILYSAGYVG